MKRRILCVLMTVMLLFSGMTVPSFAKTSDENSLKDYIPEAVVLVQVNNAECKMVKKMTDLTVDIKLKDGRDVINVPVERVEEEGDDLVALWLGYSYEEIEAQIKADMAKFQEDYHLGSAEDFLINALTLILGGDAEDMSKDLLAIFENYEIVINGIPEDADHEFEIETNTILITSTIVSELFDITVELIGSLLELNKTEIAKINSFADIVNLLNDMLIEYELVEKNQDIYDFILELVETDEITKADLINAVAAMDEVLNYMRSEEYTGTVFAGIYLNCDCPFTVEFDIYHQYFKEVDGIMTLAGTANYGTVDLSGSLGDDWFEYDYEKYTYQGMSGDVIKASDYIRTEYNGETYRFVGSYDDIVTVDVDEFVSADEIDEIYRDEKWWSEWESDSFVLGDEDIEAPTGLLLRYELVENEENEPVIDEISGITPDSEDVSDNNNENQNVTKTGDDSNMTPFYVIVILALAVMAATVVTRRRKMN